MHKLRPGLYAITDASLATDIALDTQVELALQGGARAIQYRDKSHNLTGRLRQASALLQLCGRYGVPLIINDDIALAAEIGADGVHLGKDDPQINEAKQALGANAIIGVSCYNRLELAIEAEQSGASYAAFGRFFPSNSKPDASHADISTLQQATGLLRIPVVAIGGITPENGAALVKAGASMLAVIHGVFAQPDIPVACRRFNQLFDIKEDSLS